MDNAEERNGFHPGRVVGGFIVLALGATMLADRNGWFGGDSMQYFGGVALIAIGAARLLGDWRRAHRRRGRTVITALWLMFLGWWLIASQAHLFGLTFHTSWPLLIIAAGVVIVARELLRSGRRDRRLPDAGAKER